VGVASRELGTDLGQLSNRVDDIRDEMRTGFQDVRAEMRGGFQDVRAEIRSIRMRLDTLLLATTGGLFGVIATLAVKL
jgi:translation initiation factor 2 gamma subunit (eIF-2gamma)